MHRLAPELRASALLAASLFCAGCPWSLSPFEGVWTITDGSVTLLCDGGTLAQGIAGPVVILDAHTYLEASIGGLTESFSITGNTANTFAEKLSPVDDAGFETGATISLIGDALSLSGDTLIDSASGSEEQADGGSCSFSRGFTAIRDPP